MHQGPQNTVFWCSKLTLSRQVRAEIKFHWGGAPFEKNPAKPARYIRALKQIRLNLTTAEKHQMNWASLLKVTWPQHESCPLFFPWFFHHGCSHLKQSEASGKPGLEMPDMWPKYPRTTYDIKTIKGKRDNATDVTVSCHRQRGWCALTVIASTHQRLNPVTGDSQQTVTSD